MAQEEDFERKYVHQFYSLKSKSFSSTRVRPWPFVVEFIRTYSEPGSLVLDAGCGNGRQFIHSSTVGIDFSEGLLLEAVKKESMGLVQGNVHALPFKKAVFDIALSIAVIHHLSTHERRLECLREMKRVVKDSGVCLVYAWHKDASSKAKKFSRIEGSDYLVSWKGEDQRYYHLFDEEMLRSICVEAGFEVLDIQREQENIYAVLKKPVPASLKKKV